MVDILLHIAGTVLLMAVCALASTPWPVAWYMAVVISGFWWVREAAQAKSISGWSASKRWEAIAPTITAFACAIGITAWRVL